MNKMHMLTLLAAADGITFGTVRASGRRVSLYIRR